MATKNILGHHKDWQLNLFSVVNPMATKKTFSHQFCGDRKIYSVDTRKKDSVTNFMSIEKGFGHHPMIMPSRMLTKTHYWSPFVKRLKVFNH
jgi:hypothetical protein